MVATDLIETIAAGEHAYGVAYFVLPDELAEIVLEASAAIPDDILTGKGREPLPHVTLKFGFLPTVSARDIASKLQQISPFQISFGPTSVFSAVSPDDPDVIKLDVPSSELHRIHALLAELPSVETHPVYYPHVTLAYVQRGTGEQFVGPGPLDGRTAVIDRVVFRDTAGEQTIIMLKQQPDKQAAQPTADSVHVDGLPKKKKGRRARSFHYLTKMVALMSGRYTPEEMSEMSKTARAHAGGMTKAEMARLAALADEPDDKEMAESLNERIREIEAAFCTHVRAAYPGKDEYSMAYWSEVVFDDHIIARCTEDGELYKFSFIETEGHFVFGVPVLVEIEYVPVEMAEVADVCANGQKWRMFVEYNFAEPPEWMPLLPKPGKYQHPEYGEINLTPERNQNFVANFGAGVYQSSLPINTEHAADNDGAYGWIEELRVNDDGSVDARVSWSDRGVEAIQKDRFRFVSAEWADEWMDALGKVWRDVLRGAALTVRPYFKDAFLRPLAASEGAITATPDSGTPKALPAGRVLFSAVQPGSTQSHKETHMKPTDQQPGQATATATEPAVNAAEFAEVRDQLAKMVVLAEAQGQQLKAQDDQIKALTEQNARLHETALAKRLADEVYGRVEGGVRWFGESDKHVAFLTKLASAFGEGADEFKAYVEQQRATAQQMAKSELFREVGAQGAGDGSKPQTPTEQLEALVQKAMAEDKTLTYADAFSQVAAANRKLYEQHTAGSVVDVNKRGQMRVADED